MLKRLRESRELTQEQLAAKVGVSQTYIAKLETGAKANPSLDLLHKLAKALKVKVGDLLK